MTGETRYSAIVAWVKIALPLLALALLSSLFLLSRAPDPDAALSYAELDVERVIAEQRLTRPRFAGTLEDGRAVVLVAETIRQSPGATSQILLDSVTADVELADDDAARLTAQGGRIDLAAQRADLSGGVRIGTDRGYDLTSDAVTLAIGAENLLNTYPDVNERGMLIVGNQYGQFSPFGFNGAYYYTRVSYGWGG